MLKLITFGHDRCWFFNILLDNTLLCWNNINFFRRSILSLRILLNLKSKIWSLLLKFFKWPWSSMRLKLKANTSLRFWLTRIHLEIFKVFNLKFDFNLFVTPHHSQMREKKHSLNFHSEMRLFEKVGDWSFWGGKENQSVEFWKFCTFKSGRRSSKIEIINKKKEIRDKEEKNVFLSKSKLSIHLVFLQQLSFSFLLWLL